MDKMSITPKGLRYIILGAIIMAIGFMLMIGGGSKDPQVFNYEMFDARRLVFAPVTILAGIVVIILAIIGKFDDKKQ